ncbi:MAG: protein-disulfide reductase DsbD domain-containing protein [Planctomycetota bacterium]
MCLDAHAHGMRIQHDIFRTPNRVELTIADHPTPKSYARYPEGKALGDTMPMWRVQTEGYLTHPGQLVGIVSRDAGFEDSPDAEWISGGVNSKGPNAVALGRHGNFFHWGFAASPTFMTDEAKDVFVNAVHYIRRFDGHAPIARKKDGTLPRTAILAAIERTTDAGYAKVQETYEGYRDREAKQKAELQARLDAGEELNEREQRTLDRPLTQTPGRYDTLRRYVPEKMHPKLTENPSEVISFLEGSLPFMHPSGRYSLDVDEELRALGIGNHDPKFLDRAVALMTSGDNPELGRKLLERYTDESFKTADEWSKWIDTNRSKFFFAESAGYVWLVDTTAEPAPVAADVPKLQATRNTPFVAEAVVKSKSEAGHFTVQVHIDILEGWHAYDDVPSNAPYIPLVLSIVLPDGGKPTSSWRKPASRPSFDSPGLTLFEGRLVFERDFVVDPELDSKEIVCGVRYQVCDDRMCLPPSVVKVKATIPASVAAGTR